MASPYKNRNASYERRRIGMRHQESSYEMPEEELGSSLRDLCIPGWLKWVVSLLGSVFMFFCGWYMVKYLADPDVYVSPKDVGLNGIFLFSISAIFLVWAPWSRLGIRISRIGGIEFKEIVREQASEHAEEISYLEDRIESLEEQTIKTDENGGLIEAIREPELRKILLEFLTVYKDAAFSPYRIRVWGARQPGFTSLSDYDPPFIRRTLQRMVAEDILETRISNKGNTLYRIASNY